MPFGSVPELGRIDVFGGMLRPQKSQYLSLASYSISSDGNQESGSDGRVRKGLGSSPGRFLTKWYFKDSALLQVVTQGVSTSLDLLALVFLLLPWNLLLQLLCHLAAKGSKLWIFQVIQGAKLKNISVLPTFHRLGPWDSSGQSAGESGNVVFIVPRK